MSLIRADALSATLGRRDALREIDLDVGPGELVALVGPNGAGKTTLLRALAGLIRPNSGGAFFDDRRIEDVSLAERARRLAYLPQENAAHWPLAVRDLVMLGRLPRRSGWLGRPTERDRAEVAKALADDGLAHLADRPATELSGGELRRALLARALAGEPEALLADEPTAGLDPGCRIDVMTRLRQVADDGRAIIAATHDLELAARYADRALLLDQGAAVAFGPPEAVFTARNLAQCYGVRAATDDGFRIGPLERINDRSGSV